jgi:hypothetical protein
MDAWLCLGRLSRRDGSANGNPCRCDHLERGRPIDQSGNSHWWRRYGRTKSDRARWNNSSRHLVAQRSLTDGRFELRGLPAGSYLAAAVHDVDIDEVLDPSLLRELESLAKPISLREGERKAHVALVLTSLHQAR